LDKHFDVRHLRVRVHQKSPEDMEVPVCYCFDHSPKSIADEIRETGKSTVINQIKSSMKNPGCHCEDANPQGGCCLGNVTAVVKQIGCEETRQAIDETGYKVENNEYER